MVVLRIVALILLPEFYIWVAFQRYQLDSLAVMQFLATLVARYRIITEPTVPTPALIYVVISILLASAQDSIHRSTQVPTLTSLPSVLTNARINLPPRRRNQPRKSVPAQRQFIPTSQHHGEESDSERPDCETDCGRGSGESVAACGSGAG